MSLLSKKLLSEVLEQQVEKIDKIGNDIIFTVPFCFGSARVNIYELAHKCKEWALNKGYELRTSVRGVVDFYSVKDDYEFYDSTYFNTDETEAIFKACEQIFTKELEDDR